MKTKNHNADHMLCINSAAEFIMDQMQPAKPKLKFHVTDTYIHPSPNICFKTSFFPHLKKNKPKPTTNYVKGFDSYPESLSLLPGLNWWNKNSAIHMLFPFFRKFLCCFAIVSASPSEMHHMPHSLKISLSFSLSPIP